MYEVTVKSGHPTGIRRRAGLVFTASGPELLEEVPEEVWEDPWLVVTQHDPEKKAKSGAKESRDQLSELLALLGSTEIDEAIIRRQAELGAREADDKKLDTLISDFNERGKRIESFEAELTTAKSIGAEFESALAAANKELAAKDERIAVAETHYNDALKEIKSLEKKIKKQAGAAE